MNPPQYSFPNPPSPPLNPNANPNPSVTSISSFPPHPQFNSAVPSQQTPIPDLATTLSSLQNLLSFSHSTLQSFSSIVPPLNLSSSSLAQCPSNYNHWVPPNSLFLHSLSCPSPIDVSPLLDTLQYPRTLKSEQQLIEQNKFLQPLQDSTSELCFSLDDYVEFDSNFFYHNCPGVVRFSGLDGSQGRIFTLPGVLSVECANFVSQTDGENVGALGNCVQALPSELWVARREVEQWGDYPNAYSYSVLTGLLCLEFAEECDVSMWLIVNSPRFGVIIDAPMRDHMLVLFRICLKAMFREAFNSYKSYFSREIDNSGGLLNPKSMNFECPVLFEVLRWLSSQLSLLYGEANARSFVITMLKNVLPKIASRASLFRLDRETDQVTSQPSAESKHNKGDSQVGDRLFGRPIFVYQIAAAVAALHERSLLEAKIKALRMSMPLTSYQRNVEHAHLSSKADEERRTRPDYRPLIEHDGLPTQKQHGHESNKAKTREEMLAEERDYKRRRMSYRGKKLKRSAKEVMRDIIEEYTEAITRAGGIGCLTQGDEGAISTFKASSAHDLANFKLNHSMRTDRRDVHEKVGRSDYGFQETTPSAASASRYDQRRKDRHNHGCFEDQGPGSDRNEREYYSRSPSRDGKHGRLKEHRSHRRNHDISEMSEDEHSRRYRSSNTSRHHDYELQYSSGGRKDRKKVDSPDRCRQQRQDYSRSSSFRKDEFNDRYDPSNACDVYDEQYDDGKYTRPRS